MSVEYLAAPYLPASEGGFYSDFDAARAETSQLVSAVRGLPGLAVVDAYEHWVYENVEMARDMAACDAKWRELISRFVPGFDYTGLEDVMVWRRYALSQLYQQPFYFVVYGLAQLGAMQIWANALTDQGGAVAAYRRGLSLGNTQPLPKLFEAAGARFAFDAATLRACIDLAEKRIAELSAAR